MKQRVKEPAKRGKIPTTTVRKAIATVMHDQASSKAAKVADGLDITMRRG